MYVPSFKIQMYYYLLTAQQFSKKFRCEIRPNFQVIHCHFEHDTYRPPQNTPDYLDKEAKYQITLFIIETSAKAKIDFIRARN